MYYVDETYAEISIYGSVLNVEDHSCFDDVDEGG
jgi:hypothetical protein